MRAFDAESRFTLRSVSFVVEELRRKSTRRQKKLAARVACRQRARGRALARHEQHLARFSCERSVAPAIICFLHDQPLLSTQLGELGRRVETNTVRARSRSVRPIPA